ncbi:MAG: hypothetical protein R8G01_01315 [Ilumatobacteraceae bacterium]|uniref:hypothetical protein n=1 Tax=Ilumatobacter fluminis TaxID=467091 RepID=UPI0029697C71|nr:hypothetical protein [Ilumatobacteraceae bacterium]
MATMKISYNRGSRNSEEIEADGWSDSADSHWIDFYVNQGTAGRTRQVLRVPANTVAWIERA